MAEPAQEADLVMALAPETGWAVEAWEV